MHQPLHHRQLVRAKDEVQSGITKLPTHHDASNAGVRLQRRRPKTTGKTRRTRLRCFASQPAATSHFAAATLQLWHARRNAVQPSCENTTRASERHSQACRNPKAPMTVPHTSLQSIVGSQPRCTSHRANSNPASVVHASRSAVSPFWCSTRRSGVKRSVARKKRSSRQQWLTATHLVAVVHNTLAVTRHHQVSRKLEMVVTTSEHESRVPRLPRPQTQVRKGPQAVTCH
jgi:hypothetical protein